MQVQFENGRTAKALILAANRYTIRAIVEASCETDEWEKRHGVWHDEQGGRIEIEALIAVDGTNWFAFCAELGSQTMAAGVAPY